MLDFIIRIGFFIIMILVYYLIIFYCCIIKKVSFMSEMLKKKEKVWFLRVNDVMFYGGCVEYWVSGIVSNVLC